MDGEELSRQPNYEAAFSYTPMILLSAPPERPNRPRWNISFSKLAPTKALLDVAARLIAAFLTHAGVADPYRQYIRARCPDHRFPVDGVEPMADRSSAAMVGLEPTAPSSTSRPTLSGRDRRRLPHSTHSYIETQRKPPPPTPAGVLVSGATSHRSPAHRPRSAPGRKDSREGV